jgi:C1A family cysteine protease/PKD repeat protein
MRFIIILVITLFSINIFGQDDAVKAALNPDFIDYVNNNTKDKKKSTNGHGLGYIPSPMNVHFNLTQLKGENKKSSEELPQSYDLRTLNMLTPVKNQGSLGACWSFSTMGAIESRWKILGYGEFDLSEQNMATCHGFEAGINDGGSAFIATAYMTRLSGPITEESDPYIEDPDAVCKESGLVQPAYSPTALLLPKDIEVVKKAVYNYGPVTSSIYIGSDDDPMSNYYYWLTATFYYDQGLRAPNHGVLIVGWDDNKFVEGGLANDDDPIGAWIVKNSWGEDWGKDGYFYVAYKDTKFLSEVSMFPDYLPLDAFDTLYMYDYLGATTSFGFQQETGYGIAKFNCESENFIKKIGTFVNSSGGYIDIEVYTEFQDSILSNLIGSSYNNFVKFPGYHTFDIPVLVDGDYYIKIKYYTPGYKYPVPAETKISYQGEDYALPVIENSGKFWISKDGTDWKPMGADIEDYDADLSIRVYADTLTALNGFFKADKTYACVGSDIIFTDNSNGTVNEYNWNFGENATPAEATGKGPHTVSYSSIGMKNVSLSITGTEDSETLEKKDYIEVVDALDIFLPVSEALLVEGKTFPMTAFGADNYTWSPSEGLNTTNGATVLASPSDTTTYTVVGTMGTCTGQASVTFNVVQNPPNDDVCDAIELKVGGWQGQFTNIHATVEDKEPSPPETEDGCETPMEWCIEGGLQNSVWFWFTAPPKGLISISSSGMDNQMALYKADTCTDIFVSNKFEMVAAYDDYYNEKKFYAAALDNVSVIPGQKYFLQVDGSAGGVEGNFNLIFWDYPLSNEEFLSDMKAFDELSVYPNPAEGVFNIRLKSFVEGTIQYKVYDLQGRLIYADEMEGYPDSNYILDLGKVNTGIYMLELRTKDNVYKRNIIKR